jgi:glutaminyl-tRNA synthetase
LQIVGKYDILKRILMEEEKKSLNFIEQIIEDDLLNGLKNDNFVFVFHLNPMVISI